jgi:hypothetical protein
VFLSDNIETYGYNRLCSFIRAVSGIGLVIDTNFTIVAASDDFIKKTKTTRESITGRDILLCILLTLRIELAME